MGSLFMILIAGLALVCFSKHRITLTEIAIVGCLGIAFMVIMLAQKYTHEITIDSEGINITYYTFFKKKVVNIARPALSLNICPKKHFRSPVFYVLNVLEKQQLKYAVRSIEGNWDKEELMKLVACWEETRDEHCKAI